MAQNVNYLLLFLGIVFVVAALNFLFPGFLSAFTSAGRNVFPWFLVLAGLVLVMYAKSLRARAAPALLFGFMLIASGIGLAGYDILSLLASAPRFVSILSMLVGIGLILWGVTKFTRFSVIGIIGGILAIGIGVSMAGVNLSGVSLVAAAVTNIFQNITLWIVILVLVLVAGFMKAKGWL